MPIPGAYCAGPCVVGAQRSPKVGRSAAPGKLSRAWAHRTTDAAEPGPGTGLPCGSEEDFSYYYAQRTRADNGQASLAACGSGWGQRREVS